MRGAKAGCGCQGGGERRRSASVAASAAIASTCGPAGDDCCDFGYEIFDGRGCRLLARPGAFRGRPRLQGTAGPRRNGNFGFQEGVNFAGPLGDPWGFGYQVGANFVQSNFAKTQTVTVDDENKLSRLQAASRPFLTAGIFRRADSCGGLQGGVAYDYLHDNYYENFDLQQIRGEIGWVFCGGNEIGFYGAFGVSSADEDTAPSFKLEPIDMFTMYLRHTFENAGEGRIFGGATANGDGLLGGDLWVPFGRGFALENRFTYLIPNAKMTDEWPIPSSERESWGLTIQLVWYPGQNARCQQQNPFRSLLGVADNSLFMVDRVSEIRDRGSGIRTGKPRFFTNPY